MNVHVEQGIPAQPSLPEGPSRDYENFIYMISHDVRNSVRALIEVPQWIAEDLVEGGHRIEGNLAENIALMNTHTMRLDRMLNDLLIHSRIGRMQDVRKLDLAEAIDQVCQELTIPPGIRIDIDLQAPSLWMGERDLLTLLTALFSNAFRHRDARTSRITVTSRSEAGTTVLHFGDDGPGVDPIYRERIFQAMTTLRSRDEVEGSGMGLAHLRKILQLYGGSLTWVDRADGRGVSFDLRFPD